MSAPNLVILALFCVKLSSGQGLVYRPTDMSKAIYPHFVEGEHNYRSIKISVSNGQLNHKVMLCRKLTNGKRVSTKDPPIQITQADLD